MKTFNHLICPISNEKIDSNISRLTIFFNVMCMGMFLITLHPVFIIFVALDYFIRAVFDCKFSPFKNLASVIVPILTKKRTPIDLAPKVFASRLGFACAFAATVLFFSGYTTGSVVVTSILLVLSFMDSVLNFCVGCIIYHYLVLPFFKKSEA